MLTIQGSSMGRFCDGLSRRNFLSIGAMGLGFGGLTWPDMSRLLAAQKGPKPRYKAVINLHLEGGPPQKFSTLGDPWVLVHRPGSAHVLGVPHHSSKLENSEYPSPLSHPVLLVEDRSPVAQPDENGNNNPQQQPKG